MMSDFALLATGMFTLAALALAALAGLRAWNGWLELRKLQLASSGPRADAAESGITGERIELADLKARVRKLEAIASGIDL